MAAMERAPVDELTGLPLLIAPRCQWLPLDKPEIADPNHGWFPENDPRLKTVAGIALRNSQLQILERDLHVEHHQKMLGPMIPDEDQILSRCVASCAGVIADNVIDYSKEGAIRPMTRSERDFFRTPSDQDRFSYRYIRYNYEPIRIFFRQLTFRQRLSHLREGLIDEFLFTKDPDRKTVLGRFLIANAVAVATDPVREQYSFFRRNNLLHPAMPSEAQTLVGHKLQLAHPTNQQRLIEQYETALVA
jgi:hypothetical protein